MLMSSKVRPTSRKGLPASQVVPCARNICRSLLMSVLWILLITQMCGGQQTPVVSVGGPASPKGCVFPFEDSQGRIWLAGCETGYEGVYSFDGTHFLSPEGQLNGAIVRGITEDTEGGIWLSSSEGLFRIYRGQIKKIFDGIALAGITRIAPDVFLLAIRRREGAPAPTTDAVRVSREPGGWRLDSILNGIPEVQFSQDSSHVISSTAVRAGTANFPVTTSYDGAKERSCPSGIMSWEQSCDM